MNRTVKLLSIALVVQLALAGLVWSTLAVSPAATHEPLLANAGEATAITLVDPDDGELNLQKQDDGSWQLGDGTAADGDKVNRLLERLSGLRESFPVAQTEAARARFKVADDSFRRKVILRRGDETLATLILGSSPAMGEVHARVAGTDAIYRVELPLYELPATAAHWKAPEPEPEDREADAGDSNGDTAADTADAEATTGTEEDAGAGTESGTDNEAKAAETPEADAAAAESTAADAS